MTKPAVILLLAFAKPVCAETGKITVNVTPDAAMQNQRICATDTLTDQTACITPNVNDSTATLTVEEGRYLVKKCGTHAHSGSGETQEVCTFYTGHSSLDTATARNVAPSTVTALKINANTAAIQLDCVQQNKDGTYTAVGHGFGAKNYISAAGYETSSSLYILSWKDSEMSQVRFKKPASAYSVFPFAVVSKTNGMSNRIYQASPCF